MAEPKGLFNTVPKLIIIGMFVLSTYFVIKTVDPENKPKIGESVFGGGIAIFVDNLFKFL